MREATREAIVRAAARLLADDGAVAVTTRGVAQAAGVQAPTIYRLFGDKDGLIDAVAEHVMADYVADTAARTIADPVVDLRQAWHMHIEFGLAHPTLYAILVDPRRETSSAASLDGVEVLRARVRRVAEAGLLRVSEHRAVALIHAAGIGVVLTQLSAPAERLADTAWEAVSGAILTDHPVAAQDDAVAAAVTFRTVVPRLPGLSPAERALMTEWLDRAVASPSADEGADESSALV